MKNILYTLTLLLLSHTVYCQKKTEVLYPDLKYTYQITKSDSGFIIKITRTNISQKRLIVMDTYNGFDFINSAKSYRNNEEFYYRGYFDNDTLIDYITHDEGMENAGITINCDGRCTYTKILQSKTSNMVKFKIRTDNNQFYFYEKYWFAESSDQEDRVRWIPLKERKNTAVCFPIIVK